MSKEAMQLALEALEAAISDDKPYIVQCKEAITALREALAEQPAQKRPQNCGTSYCSCIECVMEPAQQEPLTDEEIEACIHDVDEDGIGLFAFARAIEAAHGITGEKNT